MAEFVHVVLLVVRKVTLGPVLGLEATNPPFISFWFSIITVAPLPISEIRGLDGSRPSIVLVALLKAVV